LGKKQFRKRKSISKNSNTINKSTINSNTINKNTIDNNTILSNQILLVEDNEFNQEIAKVLLENKGFSVTIAQNGQEAINALENQGKFDLILMDIQMPVMDGYTATRKIRRLNSDIKNIPIIAMTSHAMKADIEKSFESGMNDHITKPIQPDRLYTSLLKWLPKKAIDSESSIINSESSNIDISSDKIDKIDKVDIFDKIDKIDKIQESTQENIFNQEIIQQDILNIDNLQKSIPSININSGLKNIEGNKALYLDFLDKFIKDYKDISIQIKNALKNKDMETAIRIAHTLKGISATLGAFLLNKSIKNLEIALKENKDSKSINNELDALGFELNTLISQVNNAFSKKKKQKKSKLSKVSKQEIKDIILPKLKKLKKLLTENDMESETCYNSIKEQLYSIVPDEFEKLAHYIEKFDFKNASKELSLIFEKISLYDKNII